MNGQIEREYREAMDSLRFSEEAKERMMKNLINQEEQAPIKRRGLRPLRVGLIAAVLCAALLGTAGAAVVQLSGMRITWEDKSGMSSSGYTVEPEVSFYPVDLLSKEVSAMCAEGRKNFRTWDELGEFIGLNLVDNPVLDVAQPGPMDWYTNIEEEKSTNILLMPWFSDDGQLQGIFSGSAYLVDGVYVRLDEAVYTEHAKGNLHHYSYTIETDKKWTGDSHEEDASQPWFNRFYSRESILSSELYTAGSGLDVTIVEVAPQNPGSATVYDAYFVIDGAFFTMMAGGSLENGQENPAHTLEVLKQVLDGFQV